MNMSLFKKKRNVPLPEPQAETPSKSMTEVHASPPAPDAAAVIGGLDWYRAPVPPGHETGSHSDRGLVRQSGRCHHPAPESAEAAILRGHAGLAACAP